MNKIEVKYVGLYNISFKCKGFSGLVIKNDTIKVSEDQIEFFKSHKDWEIVNTQKEITKKEKNKK